MKTISVAIAALSWFVERTATKSKALDNIKSMSHNSDMNKVSLQDYVAQHNQGSAAKLLGRHQTNIGLMLKKTDRTFTLYFDDDGNFLKCMEERIYADATESYS